MMHESNLRPRIAYQESCRLFRLILGMVLASILGIAECQAVTLTITAEHGSVTTTPAKADYNIGEIVELIPKPDTGYYFTGWAGDAHGKRLVLNLTMDNNKAITANFNTWKTPIGIPMPEFGIFETYRMYDEPTKRNPALTYTQNAEGGFYTHYIDNTHPDATNTGNPYGTASKPRTTIPGNLLAGSVVEVHGGPYADTYTIISGLGSAVLPIYIRSLVGDPAEYTSRETILVGCYMIFENMYMHASSMKIKHVNGLEAFEPMHHISVRNCEMPGNGTTADYNGINGGDDTTSYIVIYNNHIHHHGQYDYDGENDITGFTPGADSNYFWVVDNHIHHNGGDSIGIGHGANYTVSHIYIGRNIMHDDGENAFDVKQATDVIVSQNIMYNYHILNSSSDGFITSTHYGPAAPGADRTWYLFNEMYEAEEVGSLSGGADNTYFIGNVIHDINEAVISGWNFRDIYFIGNTLYNVGAGIEASVAGDTYKATIVNNIFGALNDPETGFHIDFEYAGYVANAVVSNNLFQDPMKVNTAYDHCISEADPLFVDAANGDFRLQPTSPAIDSGTISDVYQTFFNLYGIDIRKDIEGRVRPQGSAWDIGAYEYTLSAISDLAASGTSQNSVTVVWTLPGEDGSSDQPGRYDIRYAGTSITEANWDAANQVQGEPYPGDFGEEQSFTITALDPNTTYYIAMKTSNDTGSTTSPLSNMVLVITAASGNHAPVLELIGDKSVMENENLTFVINATDADIGDILTYSATDVPIGADFNPSTQTFTWTPTSSQSGIYHVTFQVTDGQVTVTETITITVGATITQPTLTISSTSGGSVTNPGEGDFQYDEGTVVSIQATAVENYHFVNWTGTAVDSGDVANPNAAGTTVTVYANYTIQANFAIDQHTLTISSTSGGSVTDPGEGPFLYDHGTAASVVAAPETNYYFVNWTGTAVAAGKVANPNAASTTVTVDADYAIQANFGQQDGSAPMVTNRSPPADDIQVPLNSLIILHVTDALGVAAGSVTITLDGSTIYTGGTAEFNSDTGICRRIGTPADFTYAYQSSQPFDFDQLMTVDVNAIDLGGDGMTEPYSYSFTTEMRSFGQNKQVSLGLDNLNSSRPKTVCDSSGNIWAVWHAGPVSNRDIYVGKLAAGADTFGPSDIIRDNSADQANPAIALGTDDKLYVVWQDNRQADGNNQGEWDIYISTSVDGTSWSTERRVNDPNEDNQINPAIVIDGQSPNYAYVVWQDDRAGNQDICVATSNNSFGTKTVSQITSNTANQTTPAIAVDSANTVYVLWTDARNATNDIYGAAGSPWTNVPIVTKAGSQSNPAIAVESAGTILHMLWVDQISGNSDIYYASSDGLPGSPLAGINLIDDTLGKEQVSPAIAVTGTGNSLEVFACWHDERNVSGNTGDTDLWMVQTNSGVGTNVFVGDGGTNSDQIEPAMSTDQYGYPYVVWTDDRDRYTEIYFAGSNYMQSTPLVSGLITASSGGTVGTDPNSITNVDDVSIVVPAGACPYDVTISITKIENPHEYGLPILNGYDFSPSGIVFNTPVTITIPFAVTGAAGRPKAYWYNSRTGALSQQGITDVEVIERTPTLHALRFKTTHLTPFYALLGASGGGGGGGGGGCSLSHSQDVSIVGYFLPYGVLVLFMFILKWKDRRHKRDSAEKTSSS